MKGIVVTRDQLLSIAGERLAAARTSLQRYSQISGGNQKSGLYERFVHDLQSAAREYTDLERSEPQQAD